MADKGKRIASRQAQLKRRKKKKGRGRPSEYKGWAKITRGILFYSLSYAVSVLSFVALPVIRILEIFDAGNEATKYNQKLEMQYGMNSGFNMNIVPQQKGAILHLAYNF